jgi:hypothetical protein
VVQTEPNIHTGITPIAPYLARGGTGYLDLTAGIRMPALAQLLRINWILDSVCGEDLLSTTLAEQQTIQDRIAKLERQKRRQQQEIFDVSDAIQDKREALIDELTRRMTQRVSTEHLFTIAWTVS